MSKTITDDYLFVYGTLRRDYSHIMNRYLVKHSEYIGNGIFQGRLFMVDDYPGGVDSSDSQDTIKGNVFRLTQVRSVLLNLDVYEDCSPESPQPTEFRREKRSVRLMTGEILECWIYLYNHSVEGLPLIPSGDFFKPGLSQTYY